MLYCDQYNYETRNPRKIWINWSPCEPNKNDGKSGSYCPRRETEVTEDV